MLFIINYLITANEADASFSSMFWIWFADLVNNNASSN